MKPKHVSEAMRAKLFVVAAGLASGQSPTDAMRKAGYKVATPESARIRYLGEDGKRHHVPPAEHPVVAEILAEMQAEIRRQVPVTVGDIVEQLGEAFTIAKEDRSAAAMVNATMGQARVMGLVIDKKQHTLTRPISTWSEEECMAALGEESEQGEVHH